MGDPDSPGPKAQSVEPEDGWIEGYDGRADPNPSGLDALLLAEQIDARIRLLAIEHEQRFGAEAQAEGRKLMYQRIATDRVERHALKREIGRLPERQQRARLAELKADQQERRLSQIMTAVYEPDPNVDPDTDPLVFAERQLPTPRVLVGLRQSWPIVPTDDGICGACGGRSLARLEVCLWCNRSGLDHLLEPVSWNRASKATAAEKIVTRIKPERPVETESAKVPSPADVSWSQPMADLRAMRAGRSRAMIEGRRKGKRAVELRGGLG